MMCVKKCIPPLGHSFCQRCLFKIRYKIQKLLGSSSSIEEFLIRDLTLVIFLHFMLRRVWKMNAPPCSVFSPFSPVVCLMSFLLLFSGRKSEYLSFGKNGPFDRQSVLVQTFEGRKSHKISALKNMNFHFLMVFRKIWRTFYGSYKMARLYDLL